MATILEHYGRFIHSSQADDFEMSKIEADSVQFGHRDGHRRSEKKLSPRFQGFSGVPDGI